MFVRIRKRSSPCGFGWEENSKKRAEAMEKSIYELNVEFEFNIVREQGIN